MLTRFIEYLTPVHLCLFIFRLSSLKAHKMSDEKHVTITLNDLEMTTDKVDPNRGRSRSRSRRRSRSSSVSRYNEFTLLLDCIESSIENPRSVFVVIYHATILIKCWEIHWIVYISAKPLETGRWLSSSWCNIVASWRRSTQTKAAKNRWQNYKFLALVHQLTICHLWFILGPEIDDGESEGEDVIPGIGTGIDDGFFDDRHIPHEKGEVPSLPEKPHTNGNSPRRGSIPTVFPYAPPDYGGTGVVSKIPKRVAIIHQILLCRLQYPVNHLASSLTSTFTSTRRLWHKEWWIWLCCQRTPINSDTFSNHTSDIRTTGSA